LDDDATRIVLNARQISAKVNWINSYKIISNLVFLFDLNPSMLGNKKTFLYLSLFLEVYFMNSQINFKKTHQLEKVARYMHFARKFWKKIYTSASYRKKLFSKFQIKNLMIIEFFHFEILIQYTWMSFPCASMVGLENFTKIKYFLNCWSWDWKHILSHNSSTT